MAQAPGGGRPGWGKAPLELDDPMRAGGHSHVAWAGLGRRLGVSLCCLRHSVPTAPAVLRGHTGSSVRTGMRAAAGVRDSAKTALAGPLTAVLSMSVRAPVLPVSVSSRACSLYRRMSLRCSVSILAQKRVQTGGARPTPVRGDQGRCRGTPHRVHLVAAAHRHAPRAGEPAPPSSSFRQPQHRLRVRRSQLSRRGNTGVCYEPPSCEFFHKPRSPWPLDGRVISSPGRPVVPWRAQCTRMAFS